MNKTLEQDALSAALVYFGAGLIGPGIQMPALYGALAADAVDYAMPMIATGPFAGASGVISPLVGGGVVYWQTGSMEAALVSAGLVFAGDYVARMVLPSGTRNGKSNHGAQAAALADHASRRKYPTSIGMMPEKKMLVGSSDPATHPMMKRHEYLPKPAPKTQFVQSTSGPFSSVPLYAARGLDTPLYHSRVLYNI